MFGVARDDNVEERAELGVERVEEAGGVFFVEVGVEVVDVEGSEGSGGEGLVGFHCFVKKIFDDFAI